jgi:hypothetical protein
MYPLVCRGFIALVLAYALALAPVLPLLTALASVADLGSADAGDICATKPSSAGSDTDVPSEHGSACPLGAGCAMPGCGADGALAAAAGPVTLIGFRSAPLPVHPAAEAPLLRMGGVHLARAPPPA